MTVDIKIPEFSESISEGTISAWLKKTGDEVVEGETLAEVETDKVLLEIPSPASGVIEKIIKNENESVTSLEIIGQLSETGKSAATAKPDKAPEQEKTQEKAQKGKAQSV